MLVQVGKRFISEQREIDPLFAKGMKELLTKSKVFHDCHDEFIRDLIVSSNRKEYAPNRYLMEEGSRGDSMFVLFKGVVEVTANGRFVCKLRDGSIVGEAALLNIDNRRTASVRSVQKCDVAIIFRSTFHSILEKYPWEKKKFQREMKSKLMELGKLIDVKDDLNLEQQAAQCDALKKVPFFAADEDLDDFIAELSMNATSFWCKPGKVIIQEGDTRCEEMYVLLSGAVEVTACGEFLGRLENDIFGEICVLDLLERRTANITAITQCHCMMFRREIVIPVLAKYPDARMRLLEHARSRLVALNEAICGDDGGGLRALPGPDGAPGGRVPGLAVGFGSALPTADAHLFAGSPLFKDASLEFLRELSNRFDTRYVTEGKTVIDEGTSCVLERDLVYWIAKGTAEVWKGSLFIGLLREGEVFGDHLAFAPNAKHLIRDATVKAKTKLVLRTITGLSLKELMLSHDDEDLSIRWQRLRESRRRQLVDKQKLTQGPKVKADPLDLMFMKLPQVGLDGLRVPKIDSLHEELVEACGAGAASWRAPIRELEHAQQAHAQAGRLPAFSAR